MQAARRAFVSGNWLRDDHTMWGDRHGTEGGGGGVPPRAVPLFCAIWGGGGSPPVPKRRAIFRKVACLGWRATFSPTLFFGADFCLEEVLFVPFFDYAIF